MRAQLCTCQLHIPSPPPEGLQPAPLWCVAENYRSIPAFLRLRKAIAAGELGAVVRLDMSADLGEPNACGCEGALKTGAAHCVHLTMPE